MFSKLLIEEIEKRTYHTILSISDKRNKQISPHC